MASGSMERKVPGCAKRAAIRWAYTESALPGFALQIPTGKHTKNYGKSQFLIGKSTINVPFSITMFVYQRVPPNSMFVHFEGYKWRV